MRDVRLLLIPLFLLAGCATDSSPPGPPPPPSSGPVSLAGVDLNQPVRALGTEPFWSVDIADGGMVLKRPDRPDLRAGPVRRTVATDSAVLRGMTVGGVELVVTLADQDCSDGMSDRTYPLTARIVLGDDDTTRMSGCAASTAAIMSAGESGRVGG